MSLEFLQDFFPNHLGCGAPFMRPAQVADGQQHPAVFDGGIHDRRCRGGIDQEILGGILQLLFDIVPEFLFMRMDDRVEQGFCFAPVTLEGDQDRDLIPDKLESFAVVCQRLREYFAVGNVDHAPGALVSIHPVADFQKRELEDA